MTTFYRAIVRLGMRSALAAGLLVAGAVAAFALERIALHALFTDKAILLIDGQRRVLARGEQSPEGVRLLSTDTEREQAEVEIAGRREVLKLGMVLGAFQASGKPSVTLWAGRGGHFHADGTINGSPVRFLVDTGATMIALSRRHADRLGLDYERLGKPGHATTAGGIVRVYGLKLDRVELGGIVLHNVDAGVVDGNYPAEILLGMSFLGRLDMRREGEKMELIQRY